MKSALLRKNVPSAPETLTWTMSDGLASEDGNKVGNLNFFFEGGGRGRVFNLKFSLKYLAE